MNKKFFTLFAGIAMLFSAFTVNAQTQTIDDSDGKYVFLKNDLNYLAVSGAKADSLVVDQLDLNEDQKMTVDSAMWKVVATTTVTGTTYQFTNKKTGAVLTLGERLPKTIATLPLDYDNAGHMNLKSEGVSAWGVGETGTVDVISGLFKGVSGNTTVEMELQIQDDELKLIETGKGTATPFTMVSLTDVSYTKVLEAEDMGEGFSIFTMSFDETYTTNIFNGKELVAADVETDWVRLQEVGNDVLDKKPLYFGLDTTRTTIDGQVDTYGANFVQDTLWTAGGNHSVLNTDLTKFKFTLNLSDDAITMQVKNAPKFTSTGKLDGLFDNNVLVKRSSTAGTRVLTVSNTQGALPKIKLSKGVPTTLPTGDGVYFIKVYDASLKKYKYIHATSTGFMADENEVPSVAQPEGQWYVVVKDGKYQFVDRNYNRALTASPSQIYKVTGKEAYRIDNVNYVAYAGAEFEFEYKENVKVGAKEGPHYLATNYLTKEQIENFAFTLNLKSLTPGVNDLYTFTDGKNLIIKGQTTAQEATKFKVKEVFNDRVHKTSSEGVGALILGDTLAATSYELFRQYSNDFVYIENSELKVIGKPTETPAVQFTFSSNQAGDMYLVETATYTTNPKNKVALNVTTGKLVVVSSSAQPENYFNLVIEEAPNYKDLGEGGFRILNSSEGDDKKLIKDTASINALVNAIVEPDSLYAFYVDTAYSKDPTKKLYYVTTQYGLTAAEKEAGIRNYMINPFYQDTTFIAVDSKDVLDVNGDYTDPIHKLSKVIFLKGKVEGDDTLRIYGSNIDAETADIFYKDMAFNPAAIAFATTEAGFLRMETTVQYRNGLDIDAKQLYSSEKYYVRVINNVPYWATDINGGHEFNVAGTDLFPTANENPEAGFEVFTTDGAVIIKGAAGTVANITNVLGQTIASEAIASDNQQIDAPKGIVFVTINGETVKAYVK